MKDWIQKQRSWVTLTGSVAMAEWQRMGRNWRLWEHSTLSNSFAIKGKRDMEWWLEVNNWDGRLLRSMSFFLFKKEEITARLYANGSDPVERKTIRCRRELLKQRSRVGERGWNLEQWRSGLRWERGRQLIHLRTGKVEDRERCWQVGSLQKLFF